MLCTSFSSYWVSLCKVFKGSEKSCIKETCLTVHSSEFPKLSKTNNFISHRSSIPQSRCVYGRTYYVLSIYKSKAFCFMVKRLSDSNDGHYVACFSSHPQAYWGKIDISKLHLFQVYNLISYDVFIYTYESILSPESR